jgi:hypothetical protein
VRSSERDRVLVAALLASLLLWNLPFGGLVLYPFKLLSTWFHELCHGLVMLATGAGFSHLEIYRDTSGIAFADERAGRVGAALIASAGYLGASSVGAILLVLGQSPRAARRILLGLGALLAGSALIWVRNDFGEIATVIGAAACVVLAALGRERPAVYVVNFVAAQASVQAVLDIRVLFRTSLVIDGRPVGASDASAMAAATFGTSRMWAGAWMAVSLIAFFVAMRVIKRRELRAAAAAADVTAPVRSPPTPP